METINAKPDASLQPTVAEFGRSTAASGRREWSVSRWLRDRRVRLGAGAVLLLVIGAVMGSILTARTSWAPFSHNESRVPIYLASGAPMAPGPSVGNVSLTEGLGPVVRAVRDSVVSIETKSRVRSQGIDFFFDDPFFRRFFGAPRQPREYTQEGLGSGVIVSPDGYILTNNHVVEGATEVTVRLADQRVFKARVIGTDPQSDVAVLRIDAQKLPAITLGDSSRVQVGDFVIAIGNPFRRELQQTVTFGIISATGRGNLGIAEYGDFIQTDAAINPGNSGGALVNMRGELIGINTAIFTRGAPANAGVGFAIPINMAREVMDRILKYGKVVRGYLGVEIQNLTEGMVEQFELKDRRGALVGNVVPDGPADRAGIRNGDVIIEFNGQRVNDADHLKNMVGLTPPGTRVTLRLIRNGREQTVTVELGERPAERTSRMPESGDRGNTLSGIAVDELTPSLRNRFDIPRSIAGVIISDIDPDSPAAEVGLQPGDVIMEVNRQPVTSVEAFRQAVSRVGRRRALLRVYFSRSGSTGYVDIAPRG